MTSKLSLVSPFEPLPSVTGRAHGLLEAPRPDGGDRLLYSDVLGGGVYRVPADGATEPETVLPKRRGIGGLVPHRDGGVVVTGRTVLHADGERQRELLAIDGVHGFNDVATDSQGRLYAGALRFRPFAGESPVPTEVWRIDGPGSGAIVAEGIDWPNGLGFSPDGETLYVSDTANGVVRAFSAGAAADGAVFTEVTNGAVDGLAVDVDGGVWVALGDAGVARFESDGRLDGFAEIPAGFVSSVCFGGPDLRDVFVTTADNPIDSDKGGTVFRARSEVAGAAVAPAAV